MKSFLQGNDISTLLLRKFNNFLNNWMPISMTSMIIAEVQRDTHWSTISNANGMRLTQMKLVKYEKTIKTKSR